MSALQNVRMSSHRPTHSAYDFLTIFNEKSDKLKCYITYNYVVASKCSRDRFISEKYKTVQSFTLHLLQNGPLVQLHTSASDCKCVGNIPGSQFVKAFSGLPSHS
jgi:hypothetical protein